MRQILLQRPEAAINRNRLQAHPDWQLYRCRFDAIDLNDDSTPVAVIEVYVAADTGNSAEYLSYRMAKRYFENSQADLIDLATQDIVPLGRQEQTL
ncbi:MAG: hypothetical protein MK186_13840 [Henriciella sp.]|nr:hypothetical protein [Henriciella sp.]